MWRPLRRANVFLRQRAREWTVTGFLMIRPSFTSFRICWPVEQKQCNKDGCLLCTQIYRSALECKAYYSREFALAISLVSFGSSHTFFLPQRKTLDAKRFWSLRKGGLVLQQVIVIHRSCCSFYFLYKTLTTGGSLCALILTERVNTQKYCCKLKYIYNLD